MPALPGKEHYREEHANASALRAKKFHVYSMSSDETRMMTVCMQSVAGACNAAAAHQSRYRRDVMLPRDFRALSGGFCPLPAGMRQVPEDSEACDPARESCRAARVHCRKKSERCTRAPGRCAV
jgi:hypothetical protein